MQAVAEVAVGMFQEVVQEVLGAQVVVEMVVPLARLQQELLTLVAAAADVQVVELHQAQAVQA